MSLFSPEIEIYEFTFGSRRWRYVDSKRDAVIEGQTYLAARGLKRGRLQQSPEEAKNNLEITAPLDLDVLALWRPYPPMARVHVQLRSVRVSDGFVRDAWAGVVSDVEEDDHQATIRAQTLMAAVSANGLRRCWQVGCPLALYSPLCGVAEADFRVDAVLEVSDGTLVQAPEFASMPDGWFDGGYLRWPVDGGDDIRFVVAHVGDTLTLLTPASIPVGTAVAGFAGCDHTLATCASKFGNDLNYGGQHTIPKVNPFGNDPVF